MFVRSLHPIEAHSLHSQGIAIPYSPKDAQMTGSVERFKKIGEPNYIESISLDNPKAEVSKMFFREGFGQAKTPLLG